MARRWRELFGTEPPGAASLVEQAVAWREQVLAQGDVAPGIARDLAIAARHARERKATRAEPDGASCTRSAARDAPSAAPRTRSDMAVEAGTGHPAPARSAAPRTRSRATAEPLPPASSKLVTGTRLVKAHGGRNHVVEVTGSGFSYDGATFPSLSAVAKHITGTHWNGLLFFGLRRRKTYPAKAVRHG
jgi:hypothetical protein